MLESISESSGSMDILFECNKQELVKTLGHPYVPPFVRDILRPVVLGAKLLRTDEFERYIREIHSVPYWSRTDEEVQTESRGAIGLCHHDPLTNNPFILVNRDFMEGISGQSERDDHFKAILAHESAHALSDKKTVPLTDINDSSAALLNFHTRQEVIEEFNRYRVGLPALTQADIWAEVVGFRTEFKDRDGHVLPLKPFQFFIEETRAAIIGHLLQILMYGSGTGIEDPENQFSTGKQIMSDPQFNTVIDDYINKVGDGNIEKGLAALFRDFYLMPPDRFFSERSALEGSFLEATSSIIDDDRLAPKSQVHPGNGLFLRSSVVSSAVMERTLPFGGLSEAQLTGTAFSKWGEICPGDALFSDRIKESAREKGVSNRGRNSNKTSAIIDSVLTPEYRKWLTLDNPILGTEEKLNPDLEWAIRNAVKIHERLGERGEEKGQFGFNHKSWLEHPELRDDYVRGLAASTATNFCRLASELETMGMTKKQVGKIARGVFIEKPEDILEKAKSLQNQFSKLSATKIGSAMLRSKLHPEGYLTKKYLSPKQVVAEPVIEQQAAAEETTIMSKFTKDEHQQLMSGFNQISEGIKTPEQVLRAHLSKKYPEMTPEEIKLALPWKEFADGLLQELRESKRQQEAPTDYSIQVRIVGNGRTEEGRYFYDPSSQKPSVPLGPVIKENQYKWGEPEQVFDEPFVPPYLRPLVKNSARIDYLVPKYVPQGRTQKEREYITEVIKWAIPYEERAEIKLQRRLQEELGWQYPVYPINQLAIAGASGTAVPEIIVVDPSHQSSRRPAQDVIRAYEYQLAEVPMPPNFDLRG